MFVACPPQYPRSHSMPGFKYTEFIDVQETSLFYWLYLLIFTYYFGIIKCDSNCIKYGKVMFSIRH